MRFSPWIIAAGFVAASTTLGAADGVAVLHQGEIEYPADYYGRVDLPLPQAFGHLKRLIGDADNFEPIRKFSERNRYRIMASPIGRLDLLVKRNGKQGLSLCTGWIISVDYIMTNHHCIPGKSGQVLKASLLMNYIEEGKTSGTKRFDVETKPVETSRELDYSIVRVRGNPGMKYGIIPMQAREPSPEEELFIIQHPAGKAKRLSRRNCRADSQTERPEELRHFCDTLGGSSGSPVFSDNDMSLVGLHFAGIEKKVNFAKRMTTIINNSPILRQLGQAPQESAPAPKPTIRQPAPQNTAPVEAAPSGGWQPIN
ncbi:MAG: trypsin-like peptidase domain-containing protein [Rhodospirillales bacterium]|nr:trypsin-like peptidase domain-containing protein [Rhodospirillales bacterium]